ncbi:transcription initiation factor IID, 31kD subunit-domain-containing protein [Rhizophagus diaphanus]|nr:transcription initiation factor IID, 31kD subunit-domain-containing protein [Rhizophagus diaphanus] [Rhizophagus sp. MUCL 43196]
MAQPPNVPQAQSKDQVPRDSRVMQLILQAAGVEDYEPKVVQQLLEFAHRYTVDVIQDASAYAEHAAKNDIDIDDVKLAIQGRITHSFTSPPRQEFLAQLAKERNREPLPPVPEKYGLRLPPDRHCLTAVNFQLIPEPPPGHLQKEESPLNIEISQILPEDNDDDMMEVLPYNNNTREESVAATTSTLPNADSDYDMHESPEPQVTTTTNNDWKRNRPEDDDYDF